MRSGTAELELGLARSTLFAPVLNTIAKNVLLSDGSTVGDKLASWDISDCTFATLVPHPFAPVMVAGLYPSMMLLARSAELVDFFPRRRGAVQGMVETSEALPQIGLYILCTAILFIIHLCL